MTLRTIGRGEATAIAIEGDGILVASGQDMLDTIATASYECGCRRLILREENIAEAFFDLKTGLAGEVLQKVINYGASLAIVGNFGGEGREAGAGRASKALRDFIYESNKGNRIFFVPDEAAALERLQNAPK